ncbi:MAG TPA: alpha/beta hydrolase, partial [Pyrinomonadaceae bacterium]
MKNYLLKILLMLVMCAVCSNAQDSFAATNSKINLAPCLVSGVDKPARCGKLSVFENRKTKKGRRIDLNVVVFPAQGENPARDPVFGIAGGPGQGAAQLVAPVFFRELAPVNRERDIVLVDQRGTGNSNPLNCPINSLKEAINYIGGDYPVENWKACRLELEKKADLRFYTTSIAMDDLDEVRESLGYEKINLFGVSYGTRAALAYLRQHPASVRSVILR